MRNKTYLLGEYLFHDSSKEAIVLIDSILKEWPGKCIWLNSGGKSYFNSYITPTYLIKEIDVDKSRLIVYPINKEEVSTRRNEAGTWTTFKYTVDKTKTRSLLIRILGEKNIKLGTQYIYINDIRTTDLTKPDEILTRMNVWD